MRVPPVEYLEFSMKHMTWAAVAALAVGAAHVNAADQDNATPAASGHDATIMSEAGPPSMPMQSAVAPAGKTRADVLQELIQAEKDGSLARLNTLLYKRN
jgi:predicted Rossmann fold nucleotide-binding protein DprA/Smf involved in DNA uptake